MKSLSLPCLLCLFTLPAFVGCASNPPCVLPPRPEITKMKATPKPAFQRLKLSQTMSEPAKLTTSDTMQR